MEIQCTRYVIQILPKILVNKISTNQSLSHFIVCIRMICSPIASNDENGLKYQINTKPQNCNSNNIFWFFWFLNVCQRLPDRTTNTRNHNVSIGLIFLFTSSSSSSTRFCELPYPNYPNCLSFQKMIFSLSLLFVCMLFAFGSFSYAFTY